jgi:uncharacterized protein YunC (DUF1805 family)
MGIEMKLINTALLTITLLASLSGCGYVERKIGALTGYARICVDGVEYLQFTSGASVAYTTDGNIKLCKT